MRLLLASLLVSSGFTACPIGTTYQYSFNKCYKYVTDADSFLNAEENCIALGGHLTSVDNAYEGAYLNGLANGANNYWVGLNLLASTQWTWTSGAPYLFQNWADGQPSDPSIYQCASVRDSDGKYTKIQCNLKLPYICSVDPDHGVEPSACPPPANGCPTNAMCTNGYTLYHGDCNCYKFYDIPSQDHADAVASCAHEGGKLAKIVDKEQNDFLVALIGNLTELDPEPLIGLSCINSTAASCSWTDGTPLGSFDFRDLEQPDIPASYVLRPYGDKIGVWVFVWDYEHPYLCQKSSTTSSVLNAMKKHDAIAIKKEKQIDPLADSNGFILPKHL